MRDSQFKLTQMALQSREKQRQSQRPMYEKVAVAFNVLCVGFIDMYRMSVESKSREAEQQGFVRYESVEKV